MCIWFSLFHHTSPPFNEKTGPYYLMCFHYNHRLTLIWISTVYYFKEEFFFCTQVKYLAEV